MTSESRFGTRAIHAGQRADPTTGAIMTPVYLTSTFVQASPGELKEGYDYSRSHNPTRTALEKNLASLEGARHGLCFASGCAAFDCVLHLMEPGDRVLISDDVYGGTNRLANRVFGRHGLDIQMIDMSDPASVRSAMNDNTRLVWLETPSNPMLKILDIERISAIARDGGALCAVDNTFATPYLQNPLALGADIVCHSATKYLGGHSDVVGGALLVNDDELRERLWFIQNSAGGVPSPMDCFLLLRSTKTLHVRMERHCANAAKVAEFLVGHSAVEKVIYPGLASHPQHALARTQMRGFGGMITCVLSGGLEASRKFLERVRLFSLAESLGGVESLIEHPAIMTHASVPPEQREKLGISDGLVRLSVGIEDVEDLIADLEQALG
ncbi:MAG: cystathionine gamma-synthase [Phycisphaerales bacterium JB039]